MSESFLFPSAGWVQRLAPVNRDARSVARVLLSETPYAWLDTVTNRLEALIRLPVGWDGYRGVPVNFSNAVFALRMLESTCRESTEAPQIVPGAGGDLQIEWHTAAGDVELHVMAPNRVRATYERPADGETVERDLTNDFTQVAHWVQEITEPRIAADAAAV